MLEALLEKLIRNHIQPYITGLDSKKLNLGLWAGTIVAENISLNPNIIKMLGFPFSIVHSFIGQMQIKIPWKSIASAPVEITLDKFFLVMTIREGDDLASFVDDSIGNDKLSELEKFTADTLAKLVKESFWSMKVPGKGNEQGIVDKLMLKIVDNIQITVKNIHLRFENCNNPMLQANNFSAGITLERFTCETTNENWKPEYIDRTNPKFKDQPLYKLLSLSNFCIYWNMTEDLFFSKRQDAPRVFEEMEKLIAKSEEVKKRGVDRSSLFVSGVPKKMNYIFTLSSNVKIEKKERQVQQRKEPEFALNIQVTVFDLQLERRQIQHAVHLGEFFSYYKVFKANIR